MKTSVILTIILLFSMPIAAQDQEPLRCTPQDIRDIWANDWMGAAAQFDDVLQSEDIETIYFGMEILGSTIDLIQDMCDPEIREWEGSGDKVVTGIDLRSGLWQITLEGEPLTNIRFETITDGCLPTIVYVDENALSTEAVYRSRGCDLVATVDSAGAWILRVEPL